MIDGFEENQEIDQFMKSSDDKNRPTDFKTEQAEYSHFPQIDFGHSSISMKQETNNKDPEKSTNQQLLSLSKIRLLREKQERKNRMVWPFAKNELKKLKQDLELSH